MQKPTLDMPIDPNEPRYCLCQNVSYGEMIACDNGDDCPYEWVSPGDSNVTVRFIDDFAVSLRVCGLDGRAQGRCSVVLPRLQGETVQATEVTVAICLFSILVTPSVVVAKFRMVLLLPVTASSHHPNRHAPSMLSVQLICSATG